MACQQNNPRLLVHETKKNVGIVIDSQIKLHSLRRLSWKKGEKCLLPTVRISVTSRMLSYIFFLLIIIWYSQVIWGRRCFGKESGNEGKSLRKSDFGMGWWVHYKNLISGLGGRFLILCLTNEVTYQAICCDVCCFSACFISWMPRIIWEETTESKHMSNTKASWNLWACCASSRCNSFTFLKRWWYTLSSGWQITEHIWKALSLGKTFCLFFVPWITSLLCMID